MIELLPPLIIGAVNLCAGLHAIVYKKDSRSSAGWLGVIFLTPGIGAILYYLLGINRVRRRAARLFPKRTHNEVCPINNPLLSLETFRDLQYLGNRVSAFPISLGNKVEIFTSGKDAFDKMFEAIDKSQYSVALCTYIFDTDELGRKMVAALSRAKSRGVDVKIIVDGVGAKYSFPRIFSLLKKHNLNYRAFLDSILPWKLHYGQLRNHRKLLICDGQLAFIGGMNIRQGHVLDHSNSASIIDTHFCLHGLVVGQLQQVFAADWAFCARELLSGEAWFPKNIKSFPENVASRVIHDGPDESFDGLKWSQMGAISSAKKSIIIVSPYFLPDSNMITSLGLAALKGVRVQILLPKNNNLKLVKWAGHAIYWQLLERDVEISFVDGPFDHSKIFIVDDSYAQIGSANWDSRSWRLNFEVNVEIFDKAVVNELNVLAQNRLHNSKRVQLKSIDARPLWIRVRDGMARLLTPYL